MIIFLLVLISIIVLAFPYAVMLIILSFYSWKNGLTLKTLMAKYNKVKGLFGVMLGWQLFSLIMTALAGIFAVFVHQGPAVTLVSFSPGVILSVIILELGFLSALIEFDIAEALDYVSKDLCNSRNQSIKI